MMFENLLTNVFAFHSAFKINSTSSYIIANVVNTTKKIKSQAAELATMIVVIV